MAKPDCDDGWKRFAHELFSALCYANFTGREWVILHEVFEQIYGPALKRTVALSPTEIATRCAYARPHVSSAISSLVQDRVLDRQANGLFRFNKNYELWLKGGRPRFSETELTFVKGATKRAKIAFAERTENGTADPGRVPKTVQNRTENGTQTVPKTVRAHIEDRARQRELRSKKHTLRVCTDTHTQRLSHSERKRQEIDETLRCMAEMDGKQEATQRGEG